MNILDALRDAKPLGSAFTKLETWHSWIVFLKVVYGLELDATELEIFTRHTGVDAPREGGYPEACLIVGRRRRTAGFKRR